MSDFSSGPATPAGDRLRRYVWIGLIIALMLALWGIVVRVTARDALSRATAVTSASTVVTVKPGVEKGQDTLVLPGSVQAYFEASIYARINGYVRAWYTEIGTGVKKGQLLADIEAPEVDRQLDQAQADLATAQANYELAKSTDQRWQALLSTQSVSRQDAEQRAGDAAARKAAVASAAANAARLKDMESFKRVVAPFDGVVTQRNTDVGALINAGQTPGAALFHVADTHRLRIYVSVPQAYASDVRPGMTGNLIFAEHPGKTFPAVVAFTAEALDPASRTLQVELQVENSKHELFPGSYVQVHFALPASAAALTLPANAVLFRAQGLLAAVVDANHRVHLRPIVEGRDFGASVEVLSGIDATEDIVINPPDSITEGALVRVITQAQQPEPKQSAH